MQPVGVLSLLLLGKGKLGNVWVARFKHVSVVCLHLARTERGVGCFLELQGMTEQREIGKKQGELSTLQVFWVAQHEYEPASTFSSFVLCFSN